MLFNNPANADTPRPADWRAFFNGIGREQFIVEVARKAGQAILELYNRPSIGHWEKDDGSPVSEADHASAAIIHRALSSTGIPVICEEGDMFDVNGARMYWLVDPLDGTKEFLARNGEFTVNIALVCNGEPVVGVIAIPVTDEVYLAVKGEGARKIAHDASTTIYNSRRSSTLIAAMSRSVCSPEASANLSTMGVAGRVHCGSAIKFCRVAEGTADLYLRIGRTMEWDTAAGQILLEEAGCRVLVLSSHERLEYGKNGFENPDFIALRADVALPSVFPPHAAVENS